MVTKTGYTSHSIDKSASLFQWIHSIISGFSTVVVHTCISFSGRASLFHLYPKKSGSILFEPHTKTNLFAIFVNESGMRELKQAPLGRWKIFEFLIKKIFGWPLRIQQTSIPMECDIHSSKTAKNMNFRCCQQFCIEPIKIDFIPPNQFIIIVWIANIGTVIIKDGIA